MCKIKKNINYKKYCFNNKNPNYFAYQFTNH